MEDRIRGLVDRLKQRIAAMPAPLDYADNQSDEVFLAILTDALNQHSPGYSWEQLPLEEEYLVLMLAQIQICYELAISAAADPDLRAGGIQVVSQGQAAELIKIAEALERRYQRASAKHRPIDADDGDLFSITATRRSLATGNTMPATAASSPKAYLLYAPFAITDVRCTLRWMSSNDTKAERVRIVGSTRDGDIQDPRYAEYDYLFLGASTGNMVARQLNVKDLTAETTYWFRLFVYDGHGLFAGSNTIQMNTFKAA